jgi:putative sigma-54 modulation protein
MKINPNKSLRRSTFSLEGTTPLNAPVGKTTAPETPYRIQTLGLRMDPEAQAYVRQRLGFKFGKFALSIRHIEVRVKDENGPKGAPTVRCGLTIYLDDLGTVIVEHGADSGRSAFDTTLDRAERAVRRLLQRRRDSRSAGPRAIEPADER